MSKSSLESHQISDIKGNHQLHFQGGKLGLKWLNLEFVELGGKSCKKIFFLKDWRFIQQLFFFFFFSGQKLHKER